MRKPSFSTHIQHKPLQIFSFWVKNGNGMIGRLAHGAEDFYFSSRLNGGRDQRVVEQLSIDGLRTREGKKYSFFFDAFHRFGIETLIAFHGLMARLFVFGKGGRVEND